MEKNYVFTQTPEEIQGILNRVPTVEQQVEGLQQNVGTLNETVGNLGESVTQLQETKVEKVEGKQLSTEDFTTEEKAKLDALPTNAELQEEYASQQEVGGIDERLEVVEQLGQISVQGGSIGIATPSDFDDPTPEQAAKVPTVGAILGCMDEEPTAGSNKPVKSGGVLNSVIRDGSAFDLSAHTGGSYASLSAALTAMSSLPAAYKKGGMSIKFIQSSDNTYVSYRYLLSSTTNADFTNVVNWISDRDIMSALSTKSTFTADAVAHGYWATANGVSTGGTGWARTKQYLSRNIRKITTKGNYKLFLVAWDENDNYVGTWFGEDFIKVYDATYIRKSIDLSYFFVIYPNYRFRINWTVSPGGAVINIADLLTNTEVTYVSDATSDYVSNVCVASDIALGNVLNSKNWSDATIDATGSFNVLQANQSLYGQRLATKPFMRFLAPVTIKPKQGYAISVTRYNSDYSLLDQFSAWSVLPYSFNRTDLYYRVTMRASDNSAIDAKHLDDYLSITINDGVPSDRSLAEFSNVKTVNHRGYNKVAPENTIPAYEMSAQLGYKYVETDVLFTSDGVPVLMHDDTINRTCCMASDGSAISGSVSIENVSYADLISLYDACSTFQYAKWAGVKVPTFAEFMSCCKKKNLHPWIELKWTHNYTQSEIQQIIAIIRQYGMEEHVSFISFSYDALALVAEEWDTVELGLNGAIADAKQLRTGKNRVFMIYRNDGDYSGAVSEGFQVCVYTIDTTAQLSALSNPAFDSILTDNLYVSEVYNTLNS